MRRLYASAAVILAALAPSALLPLSSSGCGDDGNNQPDPDAGPKVRPGDICETAQVDLVKMRFSPNRVFIAPCTGEACNTRDVSLTIEPDVCTPVPVTLSGGEGMKLPEPGSFDLYKSELKLKFSGAATPSTQTITAKIKRSDGQEVSASFEVVTLAADLPTCKGEANEPSLTAGKTLTGPLGASLGVQAGGNDPPNGSFLWPVDPFAATIACGELAVPTGYRALGPAITFGPETAKFQRDLPMALPINPARMPDLARHRHLEILYSGPAFKTPRPVPVSDLHVEAREGAWVVTFLAPRLGTYQAVVREDAGSVVIKRRLTHRGVIGVSMGGIGTSMVGMRQHAKFDVIAPLGGPGSWTWLMKNIEQNHLGGFRPIAPGTVLADIPLEKTTCATNAECQADETCLGKTATLSGRCTLLPKPTDPYEHTQTFNNWWAEYPRSGTGGRFPRQDYAQIFRDLALMFGNPNGDNLSPNGENLPPGVPPTHASVVGLHPNDECRVWVDPIDSDPTVEKQREIAQNCPLERCANPLSLTNYFDDEFNPDGTFPVITVCDGTETDEAQTPWANAWKADAPNNYPLEVALAVDYNGNGKRDELEPIIRSAYEPFDDFGVDGKRSEDEAGYQIGVNEDPAGDDYNAQYNPGGTERNFRYEVGEPFRDVGMDGVAGTAQQPATGWKQPGDGYDVGEGDGKWSASRGLLNMWNHDPASVVRKQATDVPGGELTDAALARLDVWTDGGLRDLFNFHVSAQHMVGSFVTRGRPVAYYSEFSKMPGFDVEQFTPSLIPWEDVPRAVMMRYGEIDPDAQAIEFGNGQHVGTVQQIASRLQTALYYIGSRWPEPELRSFVDSSSNDPVDGAEDCQINGSCTFAFTDSRGRTGPVTINFPPGYAHRLQQDRTYPVVYMLHGYGQTPEDLGAAVVFVGNWMNNPSDNSVRRLPKALLVYVDGRCRIGPDGKAECIRGGFYADSPRAGGMLDESWWMELMEHVEKSYRTMAPSEIDWVE